MKRYIEIIVLCLILVVSVILILNNNVKNNKIDNYYVIEYESNYNDSNVLNINKKYEIIEEVGKLNQILDRVNNKEYKQKFNDIFFKEYKLIVICGGIGSKVNKLKIGKNSIDIKIYYASPLSSKDEIFTYDLYLVPINKNITTYNINSTTYPDRIY